MHHRFATGLLFLGALMLLGASGIIIGANQRAGSPVPPQPTMVAFATPLPRPSASRTPAFERPATPGPPTTTAIPAVRPNALAPDKLKLTTTFASIGSELPFGGDDNGNATRAENITQVGSLTLTHYVNPTGDDKANGAATAPWRTLDGALSAAPAGAIVRAAPGSYAPPTVERKTPITLVAARRAVGDDREPIAGPRSIIAPQAFSAPTGPVAYGPLYFFRNEVWRLGSRGVGADGRGDKGVGIVVFKFSGRSKPARAHRRSTPGCRCRISTIAQGSTIAAMRRIWERESGHRSGQWLVSTREGRGYVIRAPLTISPHSLTHRPLAGTPVQVRVYH